MAGLSSAPKGADTPVDHKKAMEMAYAKFKDPKKIFVNEEAFKSLEGEELKVAKKWREKSGEERDVVIDELIAIQGKLDRGEPIPRVKGSDGIERSPLDSLSVLEKVLPKVFGITVDNLMDIRRGQLEAKQREEQGLAEAGKAIDDYDSEAEGSQLDGTTQIDPLKKPE